MKVKLDENLPAALAHLLRTAGHDVRSAVDEGLAGRDDRQLLQAATSEARILMTYDTDFADIRKYPPGSHGGIVVFRLTDQRWKTLRRSAGRLLSTGTLERLHHGLAIVDETRVRYRRMDKKR